MNTLKQLIKRDSINNIRNPTLVKSRFIQILYLTIYIGGLYFNAGRKDYTDRISWITITGFLFFVTLDILFQAMMPIALVFPSERAVFLKEENSKMYGVVPYFISRNIVDIPFSFILPAIYCLVIYWMVGLSSTAEQFFIMYLILFLMCFVGSSIGLLAGSILKDAKGITEVIPIFLLPIIVISGFFKNAENMPKWFSWLEYISPFKYGFIAITESEMMYRDSLISELNFDIGLWPSIAILFGLGVALRVLSLAMLWYKKSTLE
jgi:ABC-type multidrug transport system permease subunit